MDPSVGAPVDAAVLLNESEEPFRVEVEEGLPASERGVCWWLVWCLLAVAVRGGGVAKGWGAGALLVSAGGKCNRASRWSSVSWLGVS